MQPLGLFRGDGECADSPIDFRACELERLARLRRDGGPLPDVRGTAGPLLDLRQPQRRRRKGGVDRQRLPERLVAHERARGAKGCDRRITMDGCTADSRGDLNVRQMKGSVKNVERAVAELIVGQLGLLERRFLVHDHERARVRPADLDHAGHVNNAVVLQSDTLLHVQGSASGSMTLAGNASGPGKLTLTSQPHDANLGVLVLNGANTYAGGTVVDGGTLLVSGAGATLGTGDVTVHSANASFAGSTAKLSIQAGVLDAIANTATLSLAGGLAVGVADDGVVDLGAGVNETVGGLVLGGVPQGPGTYGSTASTAAVQNDEYFAGSGIVTVVGALPQPVLTITPSAPDVILSWPTNAEGYVLQGVGALEGIWADDTTPRVISDTNYIVTEAAPTNKFFRLKK